MFFSITQKIYKNLSESQQKVKILAWSLDYNIMFYYKTASYKCNRWEILL